MSPRSLSTLSAKSRKRLAGLFLVPVLIVWSTLAWAQFDSVAPSGAAPDEERNERLTIAHDEPEKKHLREGTRLVDRLGHFELQGNGATFVSSDGDIRFQGLENLALERVTRVIADASESIQWSVTGTVTEYRGSNYLLITHAVLKARKLSDTIDN